MALIQLTVYPRETTGKNANRRTRARGRIPAVVYGARQKAATVELDAIEFTRALGVRGGSGHILTLNDAAASRSTVALLREVQRHPVRDIVLHADLFEIPADRPITVQVPIEITGECADVKRGDAAVFRARHTVGVRCLPAELPEHVQVDISALQTGAKVHVSDLRIPAGEIDDDAEEVVVVLQSTAAFAAAETVAPVAEAEAGEEGAAPAAEEKPEEK